MDDDANRDKAPPLDAFQVRAARALLDLSQDELAAMSGLGRSTIKRLESEASDARGSVMMVLRRCLEDAGIVFLFDERLGDAILERGVAIRRGMGPTKRQTKPRGRPSIKE
ncbi:helix-turn-helix transcriptional regulator [Beijerinckia sp. L45]|uniref:helix-turn-helix domain-containing protein n=1 Tax=Beijerinckia sp. L45 TaxID=1641855 RepID=UPI00131B458B|nr:helix-turn-helix transcriptional regulator [Beijerinckia sp. L45]